MEEHIDKIETFMINNKINTYSKKNINSQNISTQTKTLKVISPTIYKKEFNNFNDFKNKEFKPIERTQNSNTDFIKNNNPLPINKSINNTDISSSSLNKSINNTDISSSSLNNNILSSTIKKIVKTENIITNKPDLNEPKKIEKDINLINILNFKIINNNFLFKSNKNNIKLEQIYNFYLQELKTKINNVDIYININYIPNKNFFDYINNYQDTFIYDEIYDNNILVFKIKTETEIIIPINKLELKNYFYSYTDNLNYIKQYYKINKYTTDYSRINFNDISKTSNIINNYFKSIFIIHLEKDLDRLSNILILVQENINFFLIDAISYNENDNIYNFCIYCIYRNFYNDTLYKINKYNSVTKGTISLNLSYQLILNYSITKNINNLLIFEDDVLFHTNYKNILTEIFTNNFDYNILWLGTKQGQTKINKYNDFLYIPNTLTWATHSIAFKNCNQLIKNSFDTFDMPVDCLLTHDINLQKLIKYATNENIFITILNNSNNQINNETYTLWKWDINKYITNIETKYSIFMSKSNNNINLENPWDNIRYYFSNIYTSTHYNNDTTIFFDFIDREFGWDYWKWNKDNYNDEHPSNKYKEFPLTNKWCGIIHHPFKLNKNVWEDNLCVSEYLKLDLWNKYIKNCSQLFVLSYYLKNKILSNPNVITLNNIKISVIKHPTWLYKDFKFDFNKFINNKNKKIIMVGWSYRKFTSIYLINTSLKKAWIGASNNRALTLLKREINDMKINVNIKDVEIIPFLSDIEYNDYLSQNIVFIDFDCASANNAVIECIARNTPIILKKHPAVVEYLGNNYPLYFNRLEEVNSLCSIDNIKKATLYLSTLNKYNLNFTKFFIDLYLELK
jgi:GR25 family glycosyltransferase involved in LPS biosynthesis